MSKKRKRSKKSPLGREALQDVQERAVPRPSQYSKGTPLERPTQPQSSDNKLDAATRRASGRSEAKRRKKPANRLIAASDVCVNWKAVTSITAILTCGIVYAWWPTLSWAEMAWRLEPDYSHGYLILPLTCVLLWLRKDTFPGIQERCEPIGLLLIVLSIVMRIAGRMFYMDFLDGYALIPLLAGLVWFLCGLPTLKWAAPAIAFLILLVPLPYRFETGLSWELQGIATGLSTALLRVLGLPAISEGHTIWVGENQLMVAEACSGMRIFVGMIALAAFWAATVKRGWVDRFILLAAAIPLALLVNATRITVTGVFYSWFPSPGDRQIIHDWSGYLMIPFAAALLWGLKAYWENLYRCVEVETAGEALKRAGEPIAKAGHS